MTLLTLKRGNEIVEVRESAYEGNIATFRDGRPAGNPYAGAGGNNHWPESQSSLDKIVRYYEQRGFKVQHEWDGYTEGESSCDHCGVALAQMRQGQTCPGPFEVRKETA